MGRVTLVIGGARSGKSEVAEGLVEGADRRILYVATARPHGREMAARIVRHKARRGDHWRTLESPEDLAGTVQNVDDGTTAVMIECLYIWTSNRLLALGDPRADDWWPRVDALEKALVEEARSVARAARTAAWDLVFVTSEVGLGTVPETPRPRAFRDLLGTVNRSVASEADRVILVVAGIPMDIKGGPGT